MSLRRWCIPVATAALAAGSIVVATAAAGQAATAPASHPALRLSHTLHGITHSTSTNWSGYAATGSTYTSVSASWVQPSVSCTSQATYSSFWVGLDGDGSSTVEQTGTEADCSGGHAVYSSWYEMYPQYPVNYSNTVAPGDHFTATVTYSSSTFHLTLTDSTRGWSHTFTKKSTRYKRASAEVIAEAPYSGGVLPLADFGSVNFTSATVNGAALGGFSPDPINMVSSGGVTEATVGGISGGTSFTDTWHSSGG